MLTLFSILCLGFFLGMRHATDADHVIAVTTIVSRERTLRGAALIGAVWGVGHTLMLMFVGGAIVVFGFVIPPRLGLGMEFSVGLMLVLLGAWNLKAFSRWLVPLSRREDVSLDAGSVRAVPEAGAPALSRRAGASPPTHLHCHPHQHGDYVHTHPHGHDPEHHGHGERETPQARLDLRFGRLPLYQAVRPLVVGIVHGMSGSAAVALLVLPLIHNPFWAVAYLAVFGLGTIAGMMLITAAIALPFAFSAARSRTLNRRLGLASGWLSLGFGVFMIYEIGCVQGLWLK